MKKIMMIATMLVAALTLSAQNNELKNEVGVYYGFASASNIVSTIASAFSFTSDQQTSFYGPIGIEYYRHVTPVVALGAMASIAGCDYDTKSNATASSTYITVMPGVKFNYLRRTHFGLYSGLAAGIMFNTNKFDGDSESNTFFIYQLTAIGAEGGSDQFRGFLEAGFGERGILCAGLRYKF